LEWLGNVFRIKDFKLPKKILKAKLDKKRKIGRSKLRWFDDVQTDIRTLGIKRWMYKGRDRLKWARITREAKVKLKGP
jgi:hypothetical protein